MKKVLKFSFSLSVFCIGFILDPSVSQAFQQEPSDSIGTGREKVDCHDKFETTSKRLFVKFCYDCRTKRGKNPAHPGKC